MEWDPFPASPASGRHLGDFARFEGPVGGGGSSSFGRPDPTADNRRRRGGDDGRGRADPSGRHVLDDDCSELRYASPGGGNSPGLGDADSALSGMQRSEASWGSWNVLPDASGRSGAEDDSVFSSPSRAATGGGDAPTPERKNGRRRDQGAGDRDGKAETPVEIERASSDHSDGRHRWSPAEDRSALRTYDDYSRRVRQRGDEPRAELWQSAEPEHRRQQQQQRGAFRQQAAPGRQGPGWLERRLLSLDGQSTGSPRDGGGGGAPRPGPARAPSSRPFDEASFPSVLTDERNEDADRRGMEDAEAAARGMRRTRLVGRGWGSPGGEDAGGTGAILSRQHDSKSDPSEQRAAGPRGQQQQQQRQTAVRPVLSGAGLARLRRAQAQRRRPPNLESIGEGDGVDTSRELSGSDLSGIEGNDSVHHAVVELEEDGRSRVQRRPDAVGRGSVQPRQYTQQQKQQQQYAQQQYTQQQQQQYAQQPIEAAQGQSRQQPRHQLSHAPLHTGHGTTAARTPPVRGFFSRSNPSVRPPAARPAAAAAPRPPPVPPGRAVPPMPMPPPGPPPPRAAPSPVRSDHSADAAAGAFRRMKAQARKAALAKRASPSPPAAADGGPPRPPPGHGIGERLARLSAGGSVPDTAKAHDELSRAPSVETECVRQNAAIAGMMEGVVADFFGPAGPEGDESGLDPDDIFDDDDEEEDGEGGGGGDGDEDGDEDDEDGPGRIVSPARGRTATATPPPPPSPEPTERKEPRDGGTAPAPVSPDDPPAGGGGTAGPGGTLEAMERLLAGVADGSVHDDPSLFASSLASAVSGSSSSSGGGGGSGPDAGDVPRRRADGGQATARRRRRRLLETPGGTGGTATDGGRSDPPAAGTAPRHLSRLLDRVGDEILMRACDGAGAAVAAAVSNDEAEEELGSGDGGGCDGEDGLRPLPNPPSLEERDAARSRARRADTTPPRANTTRSADGRSFRDGEYESGSGEEYDIGEEECDGGGSDGEYDGDVSGERGTDSMETVDMTRLDDTFGTDAAADGTEANNVSGDTEAAVDGAAAGPVAAVLAGARDLPPSSKGGGGRDGGGDVVDCTAVADGGGLDPFPDYEPTERPPSPSPGGADHVRTSRRESAKGSSLAWQTSNGVNCDELYDPAQQRANARAAMLGRRLNLAGAARGSAAVMEALDEEDGGGLGRGVSPLYRRTKPGSKTEWSDSLLQFAEERDDERDDVHTSQPEDPGGNALDVAMGDFEDILSRGGGSRGGDPSSPPSPGPLAGLLGVAGGSLLRGAGDPGTAAAFPHWTHPTRVLSWDKTPPARKEGVPPASPAGRRYGMPPGSPPPLRSPTRLEGKLRSLGGGRPSRLTGADDSVGTSELGSLLSDRSSQIAVPSFVFHRTHPRSGPRSPGSASGSYTFKSASPSASSRPSSGVPSRGRGGGGDNIFGSITSHIFPVSIQEHPVTPSDGGCQLIPSGMDSPAVPAPCRPAEACTTINVTRVTRSTQRAALLKRDRKADPRDAAAEAIRTIDAELGRSAQRRSLFQKGRRLYGRAAPREAYSKMEDAGSADEGAPGWGGTPGRSMLKRSLLKKDSPLRAFGLRKDGNVSSSRQTETDETRGVDPKLRPRVDGHSSEPSGRPPVESESGTASAAAGGDSDTPAVGGDPTEADPGALKSSATDSDGRAKRPEWSPAVAPDRSRAGGGGRFGFWSQRSRPSNSAPPNNKPKLASRMSHKPPIAPTQEIVDPAPEPQPKTGEQDPPAAGRRRALAELEFALNERSRSAVTSKASNLRPWTEFDRAGSMPETITIKRKVSPPKSRLETKLRTLDRDKSAGKDVGRAAARGVEDESHKASVGPSIGSKSNSVFESFEVAPAGGSGVGMLDVRHTLQHKRKKSAPGSLPVKPIPEDPSDSAYSRFGLEVMPPTLRRINREPSQEAFGGQRRVPSSHLRTDRQQPKIRQASNTIMVQLPTSQKKSSGKLQPPGTSAAKTNRASVQQAKVDKFRRWRSSRANSVAQESRKLVMSGLVTASNHPPAYQRNNKIPQSKYRQSNRDPPASVSVSRPSQGSPKNQNIPDSSWIVLSDADGNFESKYNPKTEVNLPNLSVHDVQLY